MWAERVGVAFERTGAPEQNAPTHHEGSNLASVVVSVAWQYALDAVPAVTDCIFSFRPRQARVRLRLVPATFEIVGRVVPRRSGVGARLPTVAIRVTVVAIRGSRLDVRTGAVVVPPVRVLHVRVDGGRNAVTRGRTRNCANRRTRYRSRGASNRGAHCRPCGGSTRGAHTLTYRAVLVRISHDCHPFKRALYRQASLPAD